MATRGNVVFAAPIPARGEKAGEAIRTARGAKAGKDD